MLIQKIIQLKIRLQYTGWLQYMPIGILALAFLLTGTMAWLFGFKPGAALFFTLGTLLLAVDAFDLITVKLHLHPREHLPERKDDLGLFDLMRSRRSCRAFQIRKLTTADFNEFMGYVERHSAAPKIGKAAVRFEYVSEALTVWPVVNATEFLVAIAPKAYDRLAVIDVGRSLQKIVMDATRMGLGTCWIGPGADHTSIMRELGDRFNLERDHIICVCAVGYKSWYLPLLVRIMNVQFHRRLPLSKLFFADSQFKEPLNVEVAPFNRFGRCFEICQWSPSSYNGQTTRCTAVMEGGAVEREEPDQQEPRLARFDFYAAVESRFYAPVALGIWVANWEMGCESLGSRGHSTQLLAGERAAHGADDCQQLPRYDVSWVLDETL